MFLATTSFRGLTAPAPTLNLCVRPCFSPRPTPVIPKYKPLIMAQSLIPMIDKSTSITVSSLSKTKTWVSGYSPLSAHVCVSFRPFTGLRSFSSFQCSHLNDGHLTIHRRALPNKTVQSAVQKRKIGILTSLAISAALCAGYFGFGIYVALPIFTSARPIVVAISAIPLVICACILSEHAVFFVGIVRSWQTW